MAKVGRAGDKEQQAIPGCQHGGSELLKALAKEVLSGDQ